MIKADGDSCTWRRGHTVRAGHATKASLWEGCWRQLSSTLSFFLSLDIPEYSARPSGHIFTVAGTHTTSSTHSRTLSNTNKVSQVDTYAATNDHKHPHMGAPQTVMLGSWWKNPRTQIINGHTYAHAVATAERDRPNLWWLEVLSRNEEQCTYIRQ